MMNMKKILSLLVVAVVATGCNNYDDQFDDLNKQITELNQRLDKIESINGQIATLNSTVVAITTALNSMSTNNAALASQITALQNQLLGVLNDLSDLAATVNSNQTNLDALAASVAALQASVSNILSTANIYDKDLVITTREELEFAKELGANVGIINADVVISVDADGEITAADVAAVTSKFKIIVGSLAVTTDASVDFSSLTHVGGNYVVEGHDVADDALVAVGNAYLDYDGGYSFDALTHSGAIAVVDYDDSAATARAGEVGTIVFDFAALEDNGAMMTSTNTGYTYTNGVLTIVETGGTPGVLELGTATSIVLGEGASPSSITAPVALSIVLNFTGTYAGNLTINAPLATSIVLNMSKINGNLNVVGGTSTVFNAPFLSNIQGNATIYGSDINLTALTVVLGRIETFGDADVDLSGQLTSGHFSGNAGHTSGGSGHTSGGSGHSSGSTGHSSGSDGHTSGGDGHSSGTDGGSTSQSN
jgi:uncharacterized protein YoxC